MVLEKTLESPLDSKEIKPVKKSTLKIIGRIDNEAEAPILWPPDVKSWLIRKDPDAGKDWRQEKGTTEDEMVGCHHWLNRHEFEQALLLLLLWEMVKDREASCPEVHGAAKSQTRLSDWRTTREHRTVKSYIAKVGRGEQYLCKVIWSFSFVFLYKLRKAAVLTSLNQLRGWFSEQR